MNETHRIQNVVLEIFKVVSDICERNKIRYFAIGGTCLGAVRHQGFIPWDDDLDIAIPIEDFQKFIDIAKSELPEHLEFVSSNTSAHFFSSFVKIIDNRTTVIENSYISWKDSYMGAWIDIMPISGVPVPGKERKIFLRKNYIYKRFNIRIKTKYPTRGSIKGKFIWVVLYPFRLLPHDYIWKKWLKLINNYTFDNSNYVGYVWSQRLNRLIFPKKWFEEYVYLDFEDTQIRCPKGYREFLNQLFGNYMEYPPEDQRTSGHDKGVVDLKHSYKDYQSGKLPLPKHIFSSIE